MLAWAPPDWKGDTAVVVASGPSAKDASLEKAKGRARFIAVNRSWELCLWADVLYANDFKWWESVKGCPDFAGLKITPSRAAAEAYDLLLCHCQRKPRIVTTPGTVGWGHNSGFGALNLAIQFGAKRILLVGYDMNVEAGTHWHGDHGGDLKSPNRGDTLRWKKAFEAIAPDINSMGVRVVNCSLSSALDVFPKMEFEAAI